MRILRKKNISNDAVNDVKVQPAQVDLEPVIDHTTANTIASKEANEEAAEKNIEASGINKVADEVVKSIQDPKKDTPAPKTPSLKPYTEAKQVADRKALSALIKECKEAGRKYKVKRSLEEGYRYVFEEFEDAFPECYFVCHSDEDANNENGYFDTLEDAKAYAEAHPEIVCIFKVCGNEEEKVWCKEEVVECNKQEVTKEVTEDVKEENPVIVEDEIPETFEGKMDLLAKDEQEAIDTYNKVLALLGDEESNVKEQLNKIIEEEVAHREFLEAVKENHDLVYEHEHKEEEPEIVVQDKELEVVEEGKEEKHVCPDCGKEVCECADKEKVNEASDEYNGYYGDDFVKQMLMDHLEWAIEEVGEDIDKLVEFFIGLGEEAGNKLTTKQIKYLRNCLPDYIKDYHENNDEDETVEEEKSLDEAVIEPVSEPGDVVEEKPEEIPAVEVSGEIEVKEPELTPELDPEAEIEIDSIETFEPTDEIGKKTMATIKDAGDGAMFAFKDTLKDLYNLKIKVSDLQKLLHDGSEWLLDLLGFNENHEEEIHPEEIPETPAEIEEPEIVGGEFDEVKPITDLSTVDINDFEDIDPVEYEEEDEKLFVED